MCITARKSYGSMKMLSDIQQMNDEFGSTFVAIRNMLASPRRIVTVTYPGSTRDVRIKAERG